MVVGRAIEVLFLAHERPGSLSRGIESVPFGLG
jgi:hypothetical protein